ncbi:molybdate transport system substrate-binding protein [Friedmanniella endophytica]|uniref:Molybdate transport system substrate-binding protein n=1 Tax=Microlunatus kandeliicorticis TaxID=1759536 RepID=A0A7W3IPW6_9ACTN|nr:molybdate ABC transporter substrate-binding protein [Microlunatus kandeliicorticis]MBA8793071.1 molybdate transport system substrate-binding protein [Microlunatus kandeliicorticis]
MTRRRTGAVGVLAGLLVAATALAGCGGSGSPAGAPSPGGSSATAVTGSITVLAAASLTGAFDRIGRDFEAAHPGTTVTFSYGSSATLAASITNGAPADVFAAASEKTMQTVSSAGDTASTPTPFVSNTLEIAVPKGNPGGITGLRDFADAGKKIALCAPQVPCGAAAQQVFAKAGITPRPDSYETDVKAALQKVASDEVDAALVYRTDVIAAPGSVQGIAFPEARSVVNVYPIATLTGARNPTAATAFVRYVESAAGQQVLADAGFAKP